MPPLRLKGGSSYIVGPVIPGANKVIGREMLLTMEFPGGSRGEFSLTGYLTEVRGTKVVGVRAGQPGEDVGRKKVELDMVTNLMTRQVKKVNEAT